MVLANLKLRKTYDSLWDFAEENLKKVKKIFKEELKDLDLNVKGETEEGIIANHLIEIGICDEDVINAVLEKDKKKWFVKYIDENNGYFEVYEVME